jgi:hypothetical protein
MRYYGISESLIKRIIRFPARKEEGIAPGTVAVMQSGTNKKKPSEIWVMFTEAKKIKKQFTAPKRKIVSAWRYPGISPIGKKIPIPDEIAQELGNMIV